MINETTATLVPEEIAAPRSSAPSWGGRAREVAIVRAIEQLKQTKPPCSRTHAHGLATHVITDADGDLHAVCERCALSAHLDRRVARQLEARAAMRRR